MKSLTMPRTLSAIYWRKIWSKAVGLDTLSLFAFSWTCHSCFPRCEPPHRCRHLWQYFIRSSACPPVCVCSSRLVYSRGSMEGLLLILCTFCFCFPPGKMQPEALCAPSSFTVAWPLCKNCSFCMKCSVLIWMFAVSQGLARVLLFECGASGYHSFPTNLGIGQERKKNKSWKPCVQETKKKRDKPRRGNLLPMSLQSDGREQRVTCVCITNKMENGCGLVRELDISFFIFFMFSAAGKEGIKWWERGSFCNWRKGDLGHSRHEVTGSLPSRLCCICSMPKTYGFSCFVL